MSQDTMLDSKLREIVENAHRAASERGRNDDYTVMQIKQAFIDEGWKDMPSIFANAKKRGEFNVIISEVTNNTFEQAMTGAEWYERFMAQEIPELPITWAVVVEAAKKASGLL